MHFLAGGLLPNITTRPLHLLSLQSPSLVATNNNILCLVLSCPPTLPHCVVFRMLQDSRDNGTINIDCVDPLGRTALLMAIDNENLEMVEVLLENKVETKDALLHAINEEFVEAVEVLLDHEETIHQEGEPWVS